MSTLINILAAETGLIENDIRRIIQTAPRRYKTFNIPKRSGGMREIAQPAREVKMLQRVLIDRVLQHLPIHDAAMAYRRGLSVRDNAAPHAGDGPILKMDFKDFFPSIRSADWAQYCRSHGTLDAEDIAHSSQLLFRRIKGEHLLKLSIGAPSSPSLSNALLFDFDTLVCEEVRQRSIKYTRYADDMTFSGQRIGMLKDIIKTVERIARQIRNPHLVLNDKKTVFVTTRTRRVVTGIILGNDGTLSLGRDRKRLLSAQVHHALVGKLDATGMIELAGQLSFANVVEPQFLLKLSAWYGSEIIAQIKRAGPHG